MKRDRKIQYEMVSGGKSEGEKFFRTSELSGEFSKGTLFFDQDDLGQYEIDREVFYFPEELSTRIYDIGRGSEYGIFVILLASIYGLIYKYTGIKNSVIGSPILEPNMTDSPFNNILLLRNKISEDMAFKDLLMEVRQRVIEANENRNYPPQESLSENDPLYPLEQMIDMIIQVKNINYDENILSKGKWNVIFVFDLSERSINCTLYYNTSLFNANGFTVHQLWISYINFFQMAIRSPKLRLSEIEIVPFDEKKKILKDFCRVGPEYPIDISICRLFEQVVGDSPDHIVLEYENQYLSYKELGKHSNRTASSLRTAGVNGGSIVGILSKRSFDQISGILGILKLRGVFLLLDPDFPERRLRFMVQDANVRVLVAENNAAKKMRDVCKQIIDLDTIRETVDGDLYRPGDSGCYLDVGEMPTYIIYTSGSTGTPKGVIGLQRGILNRCFWMWTRYPFVSHERCCQKTSMNFVDFIWEIFGPMLKGIPVAVIPDEVLIHLPEFLRILRKKRVTRIVMVPSLLAQILNLPSRYYENLSDLKFWTVSGEVLSSSVLSRFQEAMPESILLNLYGSSEVSADVTCFDSSVEKEVNRRVPIGSPIDNTQIYILDKDRQLAPFGVPGEILIGGYGISAGYLNRPELTHSRFESNLSNLVKTGVLFRSGDLGRYLPSRMLEFLGRLDQQVKVRGFRIEPVEIENSLMEIEPVKEAVILHGVDETGETYLCAYIVLKNEALLTTEIEIEMKSQLSRKLPLYMIPAFFIQLKQIPLTSTGKINRQGLPQPEVSSREEYTPPAGDIEERLAMIWRDILAIEKVGVNENFLKIAGSSLKVMILISRITEEFAVEVPVGEVFYNATLKGMARYIEKISGQRRETSEIDDKREALMERASTQAKNRLKRFLEKN